MATSASASSTTTGRQLWEWRLSATGLLSSALLLSPADVLLSFRSSMISMMSSAKEKEPPADNEMHLDAGQGGSAKKVNT
eukprot:748237-Hanusia_phi.AAC.6